MHCREGLIMFRFDFCMLTNHPSIPHLGLSCNRCTLPLREPCACINICVYLKVTLYSRCVDGHCCYKGCMLAIV